jgi:hydroxypyruvate reductase
MSEREFLKRLFAAGIAAADPLLVGPPHLPSPPRGRTLILGAGKASAAMALAVENNWPGELSGLVVTRYGHGAPCRRIEIVEAGHPLPDEAGEDAARRMLEMAHELGPDDLLLCLISGGGSALLSLPAPGLTLAEKREITRRLLRSGAPIGEINCLRKHLSAIKGGRLAAAASPAWVLTLAISDVPGDDPAVIASGPTVPDPSTCQDALTILRKYGLPEPVLSESVKRLDNSQFHLIATPMAMLQAAAREAEKDGFPTRILGDALEGESRELAREMAELALQSAPGILLSGGETTVTVRGNGRGGRNAEFLLALAIELKGASGIWALAADSDGIDGSEDNAGAFVTPDTLSRAAALGLDPALYLANNDSYSLFEKLGDLLITGPTRTNVNDFRAILIKGD